LREEGCDENGVWLVDEVPPRYLTPLPKGLSENKVFISGDMGEDDVVPLAVELIPLEVD